MKKTGFVLFLMTVSVALVFPSTIKNANEVQDQWEDLVELSREGGTTRIARQSFSIQSLAVEVEPIVTAQVVNNAVIVTVQNYTGSVLVEINGIKGATSSFFEAFDQGVGVVGLSDLGAEEYKIRVTLLDNNAVYSGTIYKGKYGHRK